MLVNLKKIMLEKSVIFKKRINSMNLDIEILEL